MRGRMPLIEIQFKSWPGRKAKGPLWPQPLTLKRMILLLILFRSAGPSLSLSKTPGLNGSITTSAQLIIFFTSQRCSLFLRLTDTHFLFLFMMFMLIGMAVAKGSSRARNVTCAPWSAKYIPKKTLGVRPSNSTTCNLFIFQNNIQLDQMRRKIKPVWTFGLDYDIGKQILLFNIDPKNCRSFQQKQHQLCRLPCVTNLFLGFNYRQIKYIDFSIYIKSLLSISQHKILLRALKSLWEPNDRLQIQCQDQQGKQWKARALKMCQIFKFKILHINKMTYIEQFLSQHIIAYYLQALGAGKEKSLCTDHRVTPNFYSLTWEILLFGENITKSPTRHWLHRLITTQLRIAYQDLRDVSLPTQPQDSPIVTFIKRSYPYVHVQMHQIMIRIILAHLVIAESGSLTTEVEEIIKEIGYIYPALKAEISFASQEINLVDWLELYLTQLIKEKSPGPLFYRFLQQVKDECNFIGPIERLFQKLIAYQDADDEKTRQKEYQSSVYEESRSESVSKYSQERSFNDIEIFRRKKKIIKEKYRTNAPFTTPPRRQDCLPSTTVQQTTDLNSDQSRSQPCSNSQGLSKESQAIGATNFSKLLKKYKKPMVRTMYQGVTKTFVPKRAIGVNGLTAEQYIENLTASSSLTSSESIFVPEPTRKYSAKPKPSQSNEANEFYVPETPKQQPLRKSSSLNGAGEGGLWRLKI